MANYRPFLEVCGSANVFTIANYVSEIAQITIINLNKVKSDFPSVFDLWVQGASVVLTKRSTGVDQNLKFDKVMSQLSVAIFIFLRTHLVAQKSLIY